MHWLACVHLPFCSSIRHFNGMDFIHGPGLWSYGDNGALIAFGKHLDGERTEKYGSSKLADTKIYVLVDQSVRSFLKSKGNGVRNRGILMSESGKNKPCRKAKKLIPIIHEEILKFV